jgi:hypothetical protein
MMRPSNPSELAQAIASQIEGVDPEHVQQMFAVWQAVSEGDPVGTVRRDQQTGQVWVRVNCDGIPKWRIVTPEDGNANLFDVSSSVVHTILYRDEGLVNHETEVTAAIEAAVVPEGQVVAEAQK